ncbi:hypothetical protein CVT25_005615 [Psilocybe cyanescens]|uniref:F5/8 type C domain-containing protein n=1 Tax=Psilocybe cyanescens TaxID=93625 RepID=A0A409X6I2_PSICY|nr:hypothetical protein CVT25_005615 [Psilocybe cyanescens]
MNSFISTFIFAILAFASLVSGAPIELSRRDVFVPPVILPNSHSVWKVGTMQTVTWNVSNPPAQITNTKAKIILVTNGKLDFEHPLADNLDVLSGSHQVKVPEVEAGKNYQILVFGDSGNTGDFFEITKYILGLGKERLCDSERFNYAMFTIFTTLVALLALSVNASPLSRRDVIAPRITSPNAQTVWPVGTVQTVTWDTSNFPPDSQITNPIGQVILGFNSSNSLNLDFNNPLAQGFKLRDGQVKITVPDVTPRSDYLIVLFGDSGNTSPSFAITQIAGGSSSTKPDSSTAVTPTSSTLITTPIPITGSVITGGSTSSPTVSDSSSSSSPTPTSPVSVSLSLSLSSDSLSSSSESSSSVSSTSSSPSPSTTAASSTSAAWSVHQADNTFMSFKTLSLCMASMIMLIMI